MRVVIQSGHLLADTIVQGSATSHMVPVDQADGESPPAGQRVWLGCAVTSCRNPVLT